MTKRKSPEKKDAVNIVTVHSTKGLKWDITFVVNVNEGIFPLEERRLFYVTCSRVKYNWLSLGDCMIRT